LRFLVTEVCGLRFLVTEVCGLRFLDDCVQITCVPKPVGNTIASGAQVQQVINIESISEFAEAPILIITFS
jgi:hypothetical protein